MKPLPELLSELPLHRVVVEAPAKINLFLEITGAAPNGYHLLESVMQAVSLSDLVLIGRSRAKGVRVTCSRPSIPEDYTNLAYRAARLFLAETGTVLNGGLHIHIDKQIPQQAGLGGGSSDAAAVLVGLNRLLGGKLSTESLCAMGLRLGADVPFAIRGGCALAQGVGEQLTPLSGTLPPCVIVLAKPSAGVSTPVAYARYDAQPKKSRRDAEFILQALKEGDLSQAAQAQFNVFERVLQGTAAGLETDRIKTVMRQNGALGAALSGSGSAVAGLFQNSEEALACAELLREGQDEVWLAEPVSYGTHILNTNSQDA